MKSGALIVNLGTPNSTHHTDIKNYLTEFLTDPRVIDAPWLVRQALVRGKIVPKRYKESARNYQSIWSEAGSPLKIHSMNMLKELQKLLGSEVHIEMAMRYQNPPISQALEKLQYLEKILILPLFPQYSSATTGSVHQKVMEIVSRWPTIPEISFINSFPTDKKMIQTFAENAKACDLKQHDHIIFSFHGLPKRYLENANPKNHCMKKKNCCSQISANNAYCYSAQCYATAKALMQNLQVAPDDCSICFQSRLGNEEWLKPYFSDTLKNLAKEGKKKLLVFSPSFVADCVETLQEIAIEYQDEFKALGGQKITLVPSLNALPLWVESLADMIRDRLNIKTEHQKNPSLSIECRT